ncbi:MAG TPA: hypothetical protein PLS63_06200 [Microthrixaceae bacterium]|nr:hypothetical protein [Microthrixaceae bacterium]
MRLTRLDHLPGSRSIEFHPRLTVVFDAPAEVREAVADLLRSIAAGVPVDHDGQVELHDILISLRDRTFDVTSAGLGSGASPVDPVLDLAAPMPLRPVGQASRRRRTSERRTGPVLDVAADGPAPIEGDAGRSGSIDADLLAPGMAAADGDPSDRALSGDAPGDADAVGAERSESEWSDPLTSADPGVLHGHTVSVTPPTASSDPAQHTRRIASDDLVRLRAELRALDGERAQLERAAGQVRGDLDSFARATLEVADGQLESVQQRRTAAEADRANWTAEHDRQRAELEQRVAELRSELQRLGSGDDGGVRDALARLDALRSPSDRLDPMAQVLATELEDLRRSMEDLEDRRVAVEELLADAEEQLSTAFHELDLARRSIRSPELDSALVGRLEAVRDEIFELEERGGRVAAARHRRRIDELRSDEALLLDQLGFDTYTAFVMGAPNRETEATRAIREDRAQARVDHLLEEVSRLRSELPGGSDDIWNRTERGRLVSESAALLGAAPEALGRLTTTELIELLSSQTERRSPHVSAELLTASGRLAAALVAAGAGHPDAAADPDAMSEVAARWLDQTAERANRRASLVGEVELAEADLEQFDESSRRSDDGGRMADLDAELQVLRAKVAEGQAAVTRHLAATVELADLRAQELELRDRERDLLVRISDRERLLHVVGTDPDAPTDVAPPLAHAVLTHPLPEQPGADQLPPPASPERADALRRTVVRDSSTVWPVDREWQLLSRLGELRQVGSVGSLPLLVCGIDAAAVDAPALLHRVASMSQIVQTLVFCDDDRIERWASGLGREALVLRW